MTFPSSMAAGLRHAFVFALTISGCNASDPVTPRVAPHVPAPTAAASLSASNALPPNALPPNAAAVPLPPLPNGRLALKQADIIIAHAYPPMAAAVAGAAALPVTIMLHGMCGSPRNTCAQLGDTAQQHGWLLCPQGNVRCGGAFDWRGTGATKATHIDAALEALQQAQGPRVAMAGDGVLMGFSRGAFVARDVAYERPGIFRGLVLIGAALKPSAARLRASGIQRVVLASGEHDGARKTMQYAAALLNRAGLPARFVSLGPVWHTLPRDLPQRLAEPLAWVRGEG